MIINILYVLLLFGVISNKTDQYLREPSNFLIIVSIKTFWGDIKPFFTGMSASDINWPLWHRKFDSYAINIYTDIIYRLHILAYELQLCRSTQIYNIRYLLVHKKLFTKSCFLKLNLRFKLTIKLTTQSCFYLWVCLIWSLWLDNYDSMVQMN